MFGVGFCSGWGGVRQGCFFVMLSGGFCVLVVLVDGAYWDVGRFLTGGRCFLEGPLFGSGGVSVQAIYFGVPQRIGFFFFCCWFGLVGVCKTKGFLL